MFFSPAQPIKAIMEKDMTTCEFRVPPLVLSDTNFWECRVSTTGGQDSGKFKVTVKGKMSSASGKYKVIMECLWLHRAEISPHREFVRLKKETLAQIIE